MMDQMLETLPKDKIGGNGKHAPDPAKPPALYKPLEMKKSINVPEQPVPSLGPLTAEKMDEMLHSLADLLKNLPFRAWELICRFRVQAAQATEAWRFADSEAHRRLAERNAEIQQRKAELGQCLAEKRAKRDEIEEQRAKARTDCAAAISTAGLKGSDESPSPELVESLIDDSAPEANEISGDYGEGRLEAPSMGEQVLLTLFEGIAPLLAGFVLAVTFGTLAGFVTLNDITKGDRMGVLLGCGALGFIIVFAVGHLAQYTVESAADGLQNRRQGGSPSYRWSLVIAACLCAVLLLVVTCEIKTESEGLRSLHEQRNAEIQRLNPDARVSLLPWWAYVLMGTIASGSYVACKAGRTWRKCQIALQDNWQASRRREWLESKRNEPPVRLAFALAETIRVLDGKLGSLDENIAGLEKQCDELTPRTGFDESTQERLDYLYSVAAAEAARFFDEVHKLVDACEPAPQAAKA